MKSRSTFSFRFKLLMAMMVVVVGVTGTTLYVTQQRVQATYQTMFQKQFESQVAFFNGAQELRLSHVKERCLEMSHSVRLMAAVEAGDAPNMYLVARDELRDVLKQGPLDARPFSASYFRLFDASGKELEQPEEKRRLLKRNSGPKSVANKTPQDFSALYGKLMAQPQPQQIGYLTPLIENARIQLIEVVFTKIIDQQTGNFVGAMILGFPLLDGGEKAMDKLSQIKSGIWLNDKLYSKSIPEELQEGLSRQVVQSLQISKVQKGSFNMQIGNEPNRVFFQLLNPDSQFPAAYQVCLYSLAGQMEDLQQLRLKVIMFGSIAMVGALLLSLLISHNFSEPIRLLVEGTAEIQKGNFHVKVPVQTRDEIGHLAESFNEMAVGLALKEKYHNVLNMVADKEVAEQLMGGNVALGGETREISVLFCDIRGFTALTQNMDPAEVIHLLNEHMTALTNVVYEHNGVVDKFVGDLIMAIFGAPKSYGNDAYNASRCALRMIQDREKLNEVSRYKIQVGIGIASGPAVAGCMGSKDRLNYTVLGERVNLASRLCGQAGRMEVVIDETTREKLGELGEVGEASELRLKGFTQAMRAYKLRGIRSLRQ